MFYKIKHADIFQGNLKKKNYFEGWYYKFLDKQQNHALAIIVGISLNKIDPHAFIQVFKYKESHEPSLTTFYFRYDIKCFKFDKKLFEITIKNNTFSNNHITLHLKSDALTLDGTLNISNATPIKSTLYKPNIMGPFAYIPNMECNHAVVSMLSDVSGILQYQDIHLDFNQTQAYIEKDWGRSFPSKYVWLQSNHFKQKDTSFMFSYATIPFMGLKFNGLISNLYVFNQQFIFSTYNFSRIKKKIINPNDVYFKIKKHRYTLEIKAIQEHVVPLVSPYEGKMDHQIKEGLSGTISIKLYKKKKLIFEDTGLFSGIEIMFI
ncbi:MAG: tocopherol cyclase family protein [Acholeplasmataceae bacterium]